MTEPTARTPNARTGDLEIALRTTGAIREFTDRPVTRDELARILDVARFAPSGGNQQAWHVVSVEDPTIRARIGELLVASAKEYLALAQSGAGLPAVAKLLLLVAQRECLAGVLLGLDAADVVLAGRVVEQQHDQAADGGEALEAGGAGEGVAGARRRAGGAGRRTARPSDRRGRGGSRCTARAGRCGRASRRGS